MIELGRGTLTCEQIGLIARRHEPVRLAAGIEVKLAAGHAAVLALAAGGPVYGRSTGVGALIHQRRDQPLGHAAGHPTPDVGPNAIDEPGSADPLLHSHATTAGPPLPADQVRAMTAVRIEQLAAGRSGLGPATATALVDALNAGRLPTVGRFHSLGTGDVAPLARLGVGLPPGALEPGDALALMSSNALSIGRAALSVIDLDRLLAAATVVTALTFLARDGSPGALHPLAAGPFPGPRWVAAELRRLGAGSRPPARRTSTDCGPRRRPSGSPSTPVPPCVASSPRWPPPAWKTRWSSPDHRVVPPVALDGLWRACATLPGATKDRDLSEDVRLAEQLLDVIAPFATWTGHDGEHLNQPDQPAEGPR